MPWLPKRQLVVPLDFSEESFAAIDVALEMVKQPAQVHLVHVLPHLIPLDPAETGGDTTDEQTRIEQAKTAFRRRLSGPYADMPLTILIGNPGHQIVDLAAQLQAELIVIPSHGRTGLARMLMGSVAERVVRLAHCPVLVLRR